MDLDLRGRRALVTGASKGIGLATARALAAEGCALVLVARTRSDLDRAKEELEQAHGADVTVHALDLADSANVDALVDETGAVDVLVNNAGAIPSGDVARVDETTWRAAWDLKVFGYVNLTRRMYAAMKAVGHGVIVNVIGAAGDKPTAGYIAGSAGNAALMAFTKALGATSPRHGIRVVGVNPGLIETDRLLDVMRPAAEKRLGDAERWRELLDPVHPPGRPEHIADLVAFLASDRSANTTGVVFTVDGGASAR